MSGKQLVIAAETFWVGRTKKSPERLVQAGEALPVSDPIVKASPWRFRSIDELEQAAPPITFGPVETASAAPGEKR